MARILTFGELMLRLQPEGYSRFVQAERFGAVYGGAEANVAVALSCMGDDAAFVTKLPSHELGQAAVNALRRYGVDTRGILRGGKRLGVYYLERGASQRASKVIYDREGSAAAEAAPSEYDWPTLLRGADWFHCTGITPAISQNARIAALEACKAARAAGTVVSFDPNYRANLWSQQDAKIALEEFMPYIDVFISNETQSKELFGLACAFSDDRLANCRAAAAELQQRYGLKTVALTLRTTLHAEENLFRAMLFEDGQEALSREYDLHIVDRVGGGDAFAAGLIHASLAGQSLSDRAEFAAAAAAIKHTVEGDCCLASAEEIHRLATGGSARMAR